MKTLVLILIFSVGTWLMVAANVMLRSGVPLCR